MNRQKYILQAGERYEVGWYIETDTDYNLDIKKDI